MTLLSQRPLYAIGNRSHAKKQVNIYLERLVTALFQIAKAKNMEKDFQQESHRSTLARDIID